MTIQDHVPPLNVKDVEGLKDQPDFLHSLLPKVLMSEGDVANFTPTRIVQSLVKETGLSRENAVKVTELVVRRIISSGIGFLSGPHIREMTCAALAELNFENERKLYTRIGMPLMDYEAIVEQGVKENANQYSNPESCHTWAADRLASEYSLLRLIPNEGAVAHLSGDIHVHMLRYFDLRPFCQEWDLRLILQYGLPPVKWAHSAVSKPAKSAMVAMLHAAKWLGIVQGEFSGGQGYDNFTTFLAPYIRGKSFEEIKQLAQCFIFESNQIYAARGAQVPFTSISCTPAVPNMLKDLDAVGPGGEIVGTYGDYGEECRQLFSAITQVYTEGDGQGKLFNFPKHEVKVRRDWLDQFEDEYREVVNEAAVMGTPYFLNQAAPWMPEEIHSQCCRIILTPEGMKKVCDDPEAFDWSKSWMNMGSLQSVSVNLPRVAYQAKGNDDRLFDILEQRLDVMRDILLVKWEIMKRRIETQILPICAGVIKGQQMLDFRKQSLSIGFVGLNEMVKYHTGSELHESEDAFNLGKRVLEFISDRCDNYTADHHVKFS
ncbi:MAG TPA: anaerobic ribonucleoside-triphosphate reductase, partial [Candidatus Lokiarchaeia archaeon]|nr:anaerobic ribonucleoside-triphosphate reductase [Candidatus Lokiarchaeia archaeon]